MLIVLMTKEEYKEEFIDQEIMIPVPEEILVVIILNIIQLIICLQAIKLLTELANRAVLENIYLLPIFKICPIAVQAAMVVVKSSN